MMSKRQALVYRVLDDNDNEHEQPDSDLDAFTDSDFEPELPPNGLEDDLRTISEGSVYGALHVRSDSASTNTSFMSSSSAQSFKSSGSSSSFSNRNRYLFPDLDTVEPLRPEELRWFYRDAGDKKWTPFIGYDSLRIECKHRETLHSMSTQTLKECLCVEDKERVIVRGGLYEVDVTRRKCYPIYWTLKDEPTIIMRGTWFLQGSWQPLDETYANDIENEHLAKFENQKVLEDSDQPAKGPAPVVHNIKFTEFHVDWNSVARIFLHYETASSKFYRAVGNKLGLSKSGTRLCRGYIHEAKMDDKPPDITHLMFVIHGIGQKMETGSIIRSCKDLRQTSKKLKEKYFPGLDEANKRVEFLPVEWRSSLKLDGQTVESITPNKLKGLRTMLNSSAMDIMYYTSPLYRSEITQGLESQLNKLYDMFCGRHPYFEASGGKVSLVAHSLGCVIAYDIITGWNPIQLYDQYVASYIGSSVVGNKLYFSNIDDPEEILDQKCREMENCTELIHQLEEARQKVSSIEKQILTLAEQQHLKTPSLKFKLDNFFCLGSPLAVFLALRGVRPQGATTQDPVLPTTLCQRLYNIYHPSDPVAYRLEPLILQHYADIKPLRIHRADATKKEPYDKIPAMPIHPGPVTKHEVTEVEETIQAEPAEVPDDGDSEGAGQEVDITVKEDGRIHVPKQGSGWGFVFRRNKTTADSKDTIAVPVEIEECASDVEKEESAKPPVDVLDYDHVTLEEATPVLDRRIDFQLREGKMEHAYLAALTSHTSYWLNQDVAMFLMSQIFASHGPKS